MNKIKFNLIVMIFTSLFISDINANFFSSWFIRTPKAFVGFVFTYIRKKWSPVIWREEFEASEIKFNSAQAFMKEELKQQVVSGFVLLNGQIGEQNKNIDDVRINLEMLQKTMFLGHKAIKEKIQELGEDSTKKIKVLIEHNTRETKAQLTHEKRIFRKRLHAIIALKRNILKAQQDTQQQYTTIMSQLKQKQGESNDLKAIVQGQLQGMRKIEEELNQLQSYFNVNSRDSIFDKPQVVQICSSEGQIRTSSSNMTKILNTNHSICPQLKNNQGYGYA